MESLKYDFDSCKKCVETVANATAKTNCTFEGTTAGSVCSGRPQPGEQAQFFVSNVTQCIQNFENFVFILYLCMFMYVFVC